MTFPPPLKLFINLQHWNIKQETISIMISGLLNFLTTSSDYIHKHSIFYIFSIVSTIWLSIFYIFSIISMIWFSIVNIFLIKTTTSLLPTSIRFVIDLIYGPAFHVEYSYVFDLNTNLLLLFHMFLLKLDCFSPGRKKRERERYSLSTGRWQDRPSHVLPSWLPDPNYLYWNLSTY